MAAIVPFGAYLGNDEEIEEIIEEPEVYEPELYEEPYEMEGDELGYDDEEPLLMVDPLGDELGFIKWRRRKLRRLRARRRRIRRRIRRIRKRVRRRKPVMRERCNCRCWRI